MVICTFRWVSEERDDEGIANTDAHACVIVAGHKGEHVCDCGVRVHVIGGE